MTVMMAFNHTISWNVLKQRHPHFRKKNNSNEAEIDTRGGYSSLVWPNVDFNSIWWTYIMAPITPRAICKQPSSWVSC